jgi:hypothetical protein
MKKWQRVALTAALTAILNDTGTYKAPWIP